MMETKIIKCNDYIGDNFTKALEPLDTSIVVDSSNGCVLFIGTFTDCYEKYKIISPYIGDIVVVKFDNSDSKLLSIILDKIFNITGYINRLTRYLVQLNEIEYVDVYNLDWEKLYSDSFVLEVAI